MMPALAVHIAAGGTAVLSGAVALSAAKGARLHRAAGTVFVAAMLFMAAMAAYLSVVLQPGTFVGSILTFYLVATAWVTVRRREGTVGLFEKTAVFAAAACVAAGLYLTAAAVLSPTGQFLGYPPPVHLFLTIVAAIAVWGDMRMIRAGGLTGNQRIARHLWRMCFAFFEATSAFFIGKQKVMPLFIQGSPLLIVLGVAPLLFLAFWLLRVRFVAKWKESLA